MDWGGQMACLIGWGSPFDADDHTYKVFGTDKGANYSGYSNALVDEYLTQRARIERPAVRKEYYDEFQVALANDPAYAFICYIDANYVANPPSARHRCGHGHWASRRRHLLERRDVDDRREIPR